jgi:hypothetical protein
MKARRKKLTRSLITPLQVKLPYLRVPRGETLG